MQPDELNTARELLLYRLARLHSKAKRTQGYRTAHSLLGKEFALASRSTQVALLQAATFMVHVLESSHVPKPPSTTLSQPRRIQQRALFALTYGDLP